MTRRNLIIDGMLSGTGIRDAIAGGYVDPSELGLSAKLLNRIGKWVLRYENAHYYGFVDKSENERLDQEGVEIAKHVRKELPNIQVDYFSDAEMRKIPVA